MTQKMKFRPLTREEHRILFSGPQGSTRSAFDVRFDTKPGKRHGHPGSRFINPGKKTRRKIAELVGYAALVP